MQRADVLSAAGDAVRDRGLNYGKPEDNFARIARLWNAHLLNRGLLTGAGVNEADVALMMCNVKQARLANDETHTDSWIDGAGYFACGSEVAKKTRPVNLELLAAIDRATDVVAEANSLTRNIPMPSRAYSTEDFLRVHTPARNGG